MKTFVKRLARVQLRKSAACRPLLIEPLEDRFAPASLTFAVIGDYGLAGQPESDVAALVHGWNPDLIITTGDNNYETGAASTIDANVGQYYHDFISPYQGSYGAGAATNRFFPTLGHADWGFAYPNPTGDQPYLNYFTGLPGNGRYYTFTMGPVQFFALDTDANEPDGITSDSVQAQWLQQQLAQSTALYKIVYDHDPPYSSSKDFASPPSRWPYQAWGATAVISGHAHAYERLSEDNNFPYFIDGLGGEPEISSFDALDPGSQVRYNGDFGAMRVTADDSQIQFQFITRTGALIDSYTISSTPSVTITTPSLPGGTANVAYTQTITATGGTGPYTFSTTAGTLPAGLSLNASTGVLAGTPTTASTYTFTVTATDSTGSMDSLGYTVTINPAITITTSALASWTVNASGYNQTLTASGGTGTLTYSLTSGTLPTGLTLSDTGVLSGTPTVTGSYALTVTASDAVGDSGSQGFTIVINPPVAITTTALPDGLVNSPYTQTISTTGGTAPLTWNLSGPLPPGLTLNSSTGVISGTPTSAGSFTFTVMAVDTAGASASQSYTTNITSAATGVNDPGFEVPALPVGGIQYNPLTSPWTFQSSAGVTANASAFTAGNPRAPQGNQVAFLQGKGSASQSILFAAGAYTISLSAAQRANVQHGGQTFQVLIDGTVVASFNTLIGTAYVNLTTSSFTVTAGSHTLLFQATDLNGGDNTVFLDQVAISAASASLADAGFETPALAARAIQYNPTGTPWTFSGSAGVTSNKSAFTSSNPNAPEGTQVAFLQGKGGASQNVNLAAGAYVVTFSAAQRGHVQASFQTFQVLVDGAVAGTFNSLQGTSYTNLTTTAFSVAAGSHTLLFQATDLNGGDNTVFLDQVAISAASASLADAGFETPALAARAIQYNPTGTPWTFSGSAGVTSNKSAFTSSNPSAPEGTQVAFLQALGSASQNVNLAAGTFTISFSAAQRGNVQASSQTFQVLVDGTVVSAFNNLTGTNYTTLVSQSFTVAAGPHVIMFQGTDLNGGDNTVFLDQLTINPISP